MRKECIKEAASVDEAKAAIIAELGVAEELIQFEVMQEAHKRAFGLFGSTEAKVMGVYEAPDASAAAENAKAYLETLLATMGAEATVTVKEEESGCSLTIDGENLGFIIGRRGDTLDALQYLTGLVANRTQNSYYRVTIDIGNYREKREQALSGLAHKMAAQAARTGRKCPLEPMNPYERRLIHTAVQDVKGATSWSVGSEPNRHVVIGPSDDNPVKTRKPRRGGRTNGNGGNRPAGDRPAGDRPLGDRPLGDRPLGDRPRSNGGSGANGGENRPRRERPRDSEYVIKPPERTVRQFVPRSNPLPVADGATPPEKTKSETESTASLYGRIDL